MKQLIKVIFAVTLLLSFGRCAMEFPPIVVLPDTTLNDSGLVRFNTIDTYETDTYTAVMTRTEGVSKLADFDIVIDETILTAYNELNGSDYTLMPADLYTMGATELSFAKSEKTAEFTITFKPAAALAKAGSAAAAGKYVVPFVLVPKSDINAPENRLNALVYMSFDDALVVATAGKSELQFVSISSIPQEVELTATTNFNQIDLTDLIYESLQSDVEAYNTANSTDCVLMPASGYTWSTDFAFDSETNTVTRGISVMCSQLDASKVYLLPLSLKSTKYTVRETTPYYIIASIQGISIAFANDHTDPLNVRNCVTNKVDEFDLAVNMNAALETDVTLSFSYDASKIATFNAENSTNFLALDPSKIVVGEDSEIESGQTQGSVKFTVDMTDLAFETGLYVLPFTIDKSKLGIEAPSDMEETVYYVFRRSLIGLWTNYWLNNEKPRPENPAPYTQANDWHAETLDYKFIYDKIRTASNEHGWLNDRSLNGRMRYMNPAGGQSEYYGWFWEVDWDGAHDGDATKKPVIFYRNVWTSNWPGADETARNQAKLDQGFPRQDSYYDMNTGIFYLDAVFIPDYNNLGNWNPADDSGQGVEVIYTRLIGPTSYQYIGSNIEFDPPMYNW